MSNGRPKFSRAQRLQRARAAHSRTTRCASPSFAASPMATRPGGNSCTTSGQRSFAPSGISRNVALFPRAKIIFHVRFQISERGTSWLSGYPPQLQNQLRLSRDDLAPNSMPWCVSTLPGRSTFRAWLDDASPANSRRAFTSATSSASTPQKTSPQSPPNHQNRTYVRF